MIKVIWPELTFPPINLWTLPHTNRKQIMHTKASVLFNTSAESFDPACAQVIKTEDAVEELQKALEFFDKINKASVDEQMAVGKDHYDWLESAARKVIAITLTGKE